ncbi:MAG TPA: hypothetical protein VM098_10185, partial [Phycisphaerae bacterium]|nr:hypothetical protein [Phycisphaerae bacterium]
PWMIMVTGLLLGLVILVPLIVAVLYRLAFAAAFVAVIALVGQAPVLALALAGGCVLAARTPLRRDIPFLATMIGLIPTAVYLCFFVFAGVEPLVALPLQKWVLYAPFVVAALSAIVGSAAVLLLTKLTGFRPGVAWPVLVVLMAGPMSVFYLKIGPAELNYRALVETLAPGDAIFDPVALDVWKRTHDAEGLEGDDLERRAKEDLRNRSDELLEKCRKFLDGYPASRHAPEVQWIKAQCSSLQLDGLSLKTGLVKYVVCHYGADSPEAWRRAAPFWQALKDRYPASPQTGLADWRLGELALAEGRFQAGYELLRQAVRRLREIVPAAAGLAEPAERTTIFSRPEPVPDRRHFVQALFEAERLLWLVEQNHIVSDRPAGSPQAPDRIARTKAALLKYLKAHPSDCEQLRRLETEFSDTWLKDNLMLARALAVIDINEKTKLLLEVAGLPDEHDRPADAAIAAKYYLGLLAASPAEARKGEQPTGPGPDEHFRAVAKSGQQPWTRLAEERLAMLKQPAEAKGKP